MDNLTPDQIRELLQADIEWVWSDPTSVLLQVPPMNDNVKTMIQNTWGIEWADLPSVSLPSPT